MNADPAARPRVTRLRAVLVKVIGYGAMTGVSVSVGLLLAELAVRLAAPQQLIQIRPDLWMSADTIGWLRRPDVSVRINTGERSVTVASDRDGFRIGSAGRREAATQVLLLGDSFVEALQVEHEQTAAHLLEAALEEHLGRPVAVRNAGVSGWSPNHYLIRARQLLARDRFGLVVVALFVGNDAVHYRMDSIPARDPVERNQFRLPRRLSGAEFVSAFLAPVNDVLEVRSHLYILLKNQLATLRMRLGVTADYFPVEYRRDEATSTRWRNTAELCRDLQQAAAARGTPVLFVLLPERFQVHEDELQRYLRGFAIDTAAVDVDQPSRLLAEALRAERLEMVDALPAFRIAAATGRRLFGSVDQHLSPDGHQVLADVMTPPAERMLRR